MFTWRAHCATHPPCEETKGLGKVLLPGLDVGLRPEAPNDAIPFLFSFIFWGGEENVTEAAALMPAHQPPSPLLQAE